MNAEGTMLSLPMYNSQTLHRYSHPPMDFESDLETESEVYSIASGSMVSSATSFAVDHSMRSPSPLSVMSINSDMQFFKNEFGRQLNNYSDVYRLPADVEEFNRLGKQHGLFIDIIGQKYVPGMEEAMANDVPGEPKACLDLGCGAGSWIIDVALDFPHCSAVGIDLIPMQESNMPPNLRSEVDDINLGLEHYYGDFNVVHARLISAGIREYHRLIDQIARVVRPGGLINLSEYDFHAYDGQYQRIQLNKHELSSPWWARWLSFLHDAVEAQGGDVNAATHLCEWVQNNPAFEKVVYRDFFLPIVPPPRTGPTADHWLKVDEIMKDNVLTFLRSGQPLLLGQGLSEDFIDELERNVAQEINERKIPQYTRLQCVYARRK